MEVDEISVHELKKLIDEGNSPFILDVREPFEKDLVDIGGELVPLGELALRTDEFEDHKHEPVVIYCRSGARSAEACKILMSEGYTDVRNLKGGILDWAKEIDPDLPTY
ncbi:rhodanese-like domain-containing protein [Balneolaceae bacterium ANBcel3]|nr:rhodanese-like domain-containing protein [Balneolaceae bacterium ANBcel3]